MATLARRMDDSQALRISGSGTLRPRARGSALPWVMLVFVLGGAGFVSYDLWIRLQSSRTIATEATASLEAARKQTGDVEGQLTKERADHDADKKLLATQLDQEKEKAKALSEKAEKADAMAVDLQKTVASDEGELVRSKGKLTLNLVDKVLFPSGKAELTPEGMKILGKVGEALNKYPDKQIWVQGHTDDLPIANADFASNWELSSARALTVVHYLQDEAKVDPKRLAAVGFGPYRPASRKWRAKNRRIEIVLFPEEVQVKAD